MPAPGSRWPRSKLIRSKTGRRGTEAGAPAAPSAPWPGTGQGGPALVRGALRRRRQDGLAAPRDAPAGRPPPLQGGGLRRFRAPAGHARRQGQGGQEEEAPARPRAGDSALRRFAYPSGVANQARWSCRSGAGSGSSRRWPRLASVLLIVSTFGPFSMVEAGVILTAWGVLALLRARARGPPVPPALRRRHRDPGRRGLGGAAHRDRLFDRSLGQNVLALACAALLAAAGLRERAIRPRDDVPRRPRAGAWPGWLPRTGARPWPTTRSPCRWRATRTRPRRCRGLRGGLARGPRPQGPPRPR